MTFDLNVSEKDVTDNFLSGPGQFLVKKTLLQLSRVSPFRALFGPYKVIGTGDTAPMDQDQRWADYQRFDWSIRQLPAINVFEEMTEDKSSDNAWLNGSIAIQVYWSPNMRRSDLARVPAAFKGAIQNFFASKSVTDMLDEIYYHQRDMKVHGLNEFGKMMTWSPNTEGIVESELVPVTIVSVKYRIDLRSWYRSIEFDNRTKDLPFERTLSDLKVIGGKYDGQTKEQDDHAELPDELLVNQ